ncbi:MAG: TlpA family protein disulfide reductase [Rhizobiaceae bacterium]|nr:MAG: TlpA family protein disulfide reductase [Rhizobiaceae bacterium]
MAEGRKTSPAMRLTAAIVAAVVIAGGIALYVTERGSGNNADTTASIGGTAQCSGDVAKAKAVGAAATGQLAAMSPADPPIALSGLAFNGPDGKPTTLGAFKGKTVLLNVWATWCAPCRAEMPELDHLQAEKGNPGFQVVAVNVDTGSDEKPKKFFSETGVKSLKLYRDDTLEVFNNLKKQGLALGLPVSLIVAKDGCLLAHMNGPAAWASEDAGHLIDVAGS